MDVSVTGAFCFLLLILPQISLQQACNPPNPGNIQENNELGHTVLTIPVAEGVTVELNPDTNEYFTLEGNVLKAAVVFDYEAQKSVTVGISCITPEGQREQYQIVVLVRDVNDNPPVFEKSLYEETINELSPPNTVVGTFSAKDLDESGNGKLYYKLTPESEGFSLVASGISDVIVVTTKTFDFDKNKSFLLELYVQDTVIGSTDSPSFHDTTTINVTIKDIDNRPPWFQPCTPLEISGTTVCVGEQSYTGSVYLNEQETETLELNPNPIRAIDGDSGLNEKIVYSIISGNDAGVFTIDSSTGSISMLKPVTTSGTITLRVLATQEVNVHQFAITSVSIAVLVRSAHEPKFPTTLYEGLITTVGIMAENKNDMGTLLRILATDEDYAPEGTNPDIVYSIVGNDFFSLNNGYLFMTKQQEDNIYELQVHAVDSKTKEQATVRVLVEVKSGPIVPPSTSTTTGSLPTEVTPSLAPTQSTGTTLSGATPSSAEPTQSTGTTLSGATPSSADPTLSTGTTISGGTPTVSQTSLSTSTGSGIPATIPTLTPDNSEPTASTSVSGVPTPVETTTSGVTPGNITPSGTPIVTPGSSQNPDGSGATPPTSPTGDGPVSTTNTEPCTEWPPGGFRSSDMAALGATLGVLLILALVIIALLFCRLRRENKDWKKIYESDIFRSSMGQNLGGAKDGVQYTNNAFDKDEDNDDKRGIDSPVNDVVFSPLPDRKDYTKYESIVEPQLPQQDDNSSQSGSEKEVKPILTKERRVEEGYKSVWFKEDIDPNSKEEVVIIPDNGSDDDDEDEDEDSSSDKEDESPRRTNRVMFSNLPDEKDGEVQSVDI